MIRLRPAKQNLLTLLRAGILTSLANMRRLGACLLACCLTFGLAPRVLAQESEESFISREYQLKALFLYQFGGGNYVEWPDAAFSNDEAPFVIGLLGHTPVEKTLQDVSIKYKIKGRKIVVQQFDPMSTTQTCQILFIGRDVGPAIQKQVVEKMQNQPVLIVGETVGFAGRGGSMNFVIESNKIHIEINLDAAKHQQLKISAKLLGLSNAKIVESSETTQH